MSTTAMPAGGYCAHLLSTMDPRFGFRPRGLPPRVSGRTWDFLRIASKGNGSRDKGMVVRATIHGDETAGGLTILNYLDAVAAALNSRPRKTLGWRTPAETLDELLLSAQQGGVATTR